MAVWLVKRLRKFRIVHRWIGATIGILLLISSVTGILLALKKDVQILQPSTQEGTSTILSDWKSIDELSSIAIENLHAIVPDAKENKVDRIDARPSRGIVKVIFEHGSWEVQVDGVSGKVLSTARRHSDWIESLHDGSIVSDGFKLLSMNVLGWGAMILIFTGGWLYFGPRIYRHRKRQHRLD